MSSERFVNWAGTVRADFGRVERPGSEAELVAAVAAAASAGERMKAWGAGHSWSAVAAPERVGLQLDRLAGIEAIDPVARTVTVRAGTRLRDLSAALDAHGLAMPILGSVAEQSIAGAISTGTHGSSVHHGNLASLVRGLRLVTADGALRVASRESDPDLFAAARVGLGALGILSELTLQVVPAFRLEERTRSLPVEEAIADAPALLASAPYAKLWWLPHTDQAVLFTATPTEAPVSERPWQRRVDAAINDWAFGPLLAAGARLPALVGPMNRVVGASYLRPTRRVNRSDLVFNLVMPPSHREAEAAVALERAGEALGALRDLIRAGGHRVGFIQELRAVAADDAWLSPASGRATAQLGAYIPHSAQADAFFADFWSAMESFDARPHWGKEIGWAPGQIRASFPRFEDFAALRARLDPGGLFLNAMTRALFG